MQFTYQARITQ